MARNVVDDAHDMRASVRWARGASNAMKGIFVRAGVRERALGRGRVRAYKWRFARCPAQLEPKLWRSRLWRAAERGNMMALARVYG